MWAREPVTQRMLGRTGTFPSNRHWIMTPEVLESGSDDARVQKMPKGSWNELALWKIAHTLEQLVGEQSGIWDELVQIQKSSERTEDVLQELVDQTKAYSDVMELFVSGEHLLRIWKMGKPEGQEEVESMLRRYHRILGTGSREKELEGESEVVLEADVEMTLQ